MTEVAITRGKAHPGREEIHDQVKRTINLLGGINKYVRPSESILIKPNICADYPADQGATTEPFLVEAIADLCMEAGAREVIVGEGSGVGKDTLQCMESTGWSFLREKGIKLLDLNKDAIPIKIKNGLVLKEVKVAKAVLEIDALINVPVLKTHAATLMTCCMKNLKGILSYSSKKSLHILGLEEGIVDLNSIIRPRLNVVDALTAQEGLGPVAGNPVFLGIIFAGNDAVAVDTVGATIMGVDPGEIKHLSLAGMANLGVNKIRNISIRGENLEDLIHPFKLPYIQEDFAGICIENSKACSGCTVQLMVTLKKMKVSGELDILLNRCGKVNIYIGPEAELQGDNKNICVGKCQTQNMYKCDLFLEGCPPASWHLRDLIRKKLLGMPVLVDPDN